MHGRYHVCDNYLNLRYNPLSNIHYPLPFNYREFSSHRLVMLNTNNEIISCFCLREYPNIVSILPESWPQVLKRHYNLNSMTPENTLFVHLFVWDLRYDWNVLIYYMKSVYLCMFRLQYIVFVALPGTPYGYCCIIDFWKLVLTFSVCLQINMSLIICWWNTFIKSYQSRANQKKWQANARHYTLRIEAVLYRKLLLVMPRKFLVVIYLPMCRVVVNSVLISGPKTTMILSKCWTRMNHVFVKYMGNITSPTCC